MKFSDKQYVNDEYNRYLKYASELKEPDMDYLIEDIKQNCLRPFTLREFMEIY